MSNTPIVGTGGPVGPPGPVGPEGPQGIQGPAGGGITLLGNRTVAEMNLDDGSTSSPGDTWVMLNAGTITTGSEPLTVVIGEMVAWTDSGKWVSLGIHKGDQGIPGPIGPEGPIGPQGEIGPVGPQGPIGPQGVKGDKGNTGDTGPQGPQGLKGDKGDTGDDSTVPGPVGPIGPEGPQGIQGEKGDKGDKGDQGIPGDSGYIVGELKQVVAPLPPLPFGWYLADGNNGTVDLRGRFIVGEDGTNFVAGDTGGALPTAKTTSSSGSHTHPIGTYSGGAHSHTASASNESSHTHGGNGTDNQGAHAHTTSAVALTLAQIPGLGSNVRINLAGNTQSDNHSLTTSAARGQDAGAATSNPISSGGLNGATHSHGNTNTTGGHSHTVNTTKAGSAHSHNVTVDSGGSHSHSAYSTAEGAHTHTVEAESLPPYFVAVWIQYTGV